MTYLSRVRLSSRTNHDDGSECPLRLPVLNVEEFRLHRRPRIPPDRWTCHHGESRPQQPR